MKYIEGVVLPVDIDGRLEIAMRAVESVFSERNYLGEPVVTSFADGDHGTNSYHYKGRAFDIRTKGTGMTNWIHFNIKKRLSHMGFDVVLEDEGEANEHIHIEIDKRADTEEALRGSKDEGSTDGRGEGDEAGSVRADSVEPDEGDS